MCCALGDDGRTARKSRWFVGNWTVVGEDYWCNTSRQVWLVGWLVMLVNIRSVLNIYAGNELAIARKEIPFEEQELAFTTRSKSEWANMTAGKGEQPFDLPRVHLALPSVLTFHYKPTRRIDPEASSISILAREEISMVALGLMLFLEACANIDYGIAQHLSSFGHKGAIASD